MKNHYVAFILAGGLFLLSGFYIQQIPEELSDMVVALVFDDLDDYDNVENYPDSTLNYTGKLPTCCGMPENPVTKNYVTRVCHKSPAYIYYALYMLFDKEAYWNYSACTYDETMREKFKKISNGRDIIKDRFNVRAENWSGEHSEFRFYDGQALQNAFNNIYRKPKKKFHGLQMQLIYDASIKDYCRDMGRVIKKVMDQKQEFEKLAAEYLDKAKTDTTFEGQGLTIEATKKLLGDSYWENYPCLRYSASRIVGIMLRRQCDGSLPVLLECFTIMIKDYDNELYEEMKGSF